MAITRVPELQVVTGRAIGFLALGASLYDILTKLKAQPETYTVIDLSYDFEAPLTAPILLTLPANGIRLRFDGPDQRLRLIEIIDFSKCYLTYNGNDIGRIGNRLSGSERPSFRHIYDRLLGPTNEGDFIKPSERRKDALGSYVLSYPGVAFSFPLSATAWPPDADYVTTLSSAAASSASSMAVFDGASWKESCHHLYAKPCSYPRSSRLDTRGKEDQPREVELVKIFGNGKLKMIRRVPHTPFDIILGRTTPQDLITELGPPDAIYQKSDRRLSIHRARADLHAVHASDPRYDCTPSPFEASENITTPSCYAKIEDSDTEDRSHSMLEDGDDPIVELFYNYFHHGFDILLSLPPVLKGQRKAVQNCPTDSLVATKILLHGNVPGSYPFNRYRRCRWVINLEASGHQTLDLDSEVDYATISKHLTKALPNQNSGSGMAINRDWDSPGSSCELLGGWEEQTGLSKQKNQLIGGVGYGNTVLHGFPGMVFEVLKNGFISCLTVY